MDMRMTTIPAVVVIGLFTLVQLLGIGCATFDPSTEVYILCNTQKYPDGSAFGKGLSALLTALKRESASSASWHRSSSAYGGSDKVYGAYQCRGDVPPDVCSQCVGDAAQAALDSCPNAIGSRVQLDGCFLRYENSPFFKEDSSIVVELCNTQKDNSTAFQSQVEQLLTTVTAFAPNRRGLYASASAPYPDVPGGRLYALAQCLGYLSKADCSDCLSSHADSWQDCDHGVGAQIHTASCYYRFEIYPFYNVEMS